MYISGAKVAQYASANLHKKIILQPAYGKCLLNLIVKNLSSFLILQSARRWLERAYVPCLNCTAMVTMPTQEEDSIEGWGINNPRYT